MQRARCAVLTHPSCGSAITAETRFAFASRRATSATAVFYASVQEDTEYRGSARNVRIRTEKLACLDVTLRPAAQRSLV